MPRLGNLPARRHDTALLQNAYLRCRETENVGQYLLAVLAQPRGAWNRLPRRADEGGGRSGSSIAHAARMSDVHQERVGGREEGICSQSFRQGPVRGPAHAVVVE